MKLQCRISGLTFYSAYHFKNEPTVRNALHPIFSVSLRDLLAKAQKYGRGDYTEEEEKLLFLALLNKTDAVDWEVPANPSPDTVDRYLDSIFILLSWYEKVTPGALKLPRMRVSEHNKNLANIGMFIQSWYDVRKEWMSPSIKKFMADLLEHREHLMQRLINSRRDTFEYAGKLASWAMDAADVHPDRRAEWTALFKMKPDKEALTCDLDELLDMRDHMERHLYAVEGLGHKSGLSGDTAKKVMDHIHRLVEIREGGMIALLGGFGITATDDFQHKVNTGGVTTTDIQQLKSKIQESGAPNTEPKKEDYPNLISFIKAKSAWVLSSHLRENLAFAEQHSSQIIDTNETPE